MSWATNVEKMTVTGEGYAIFTMFSLQSGSLYSLQGIDTGNSVLIEVEQDVQLQFASAENNAADVISIETDNSVTIETPQRKKYIDGLNGTEKSASAAAAVESIVVTVLDTSKATLQKFQAMDGEPVIVTVGLGKSPSGQSRGVARLCGKVTGGFTRQTQSNTYVPMAITISGGITYDPTGGTSVAYTDYNAAVPNPTPVGETAAITIPDIASAGNYTTLLQGKLYLLDS